MNLSHDERPEGRRVLVLWLDSVDYGIARAMAQGGEMPHFADLLKRGTVSAIKNDRNFSSECSYGMILTGCFPERTRRFAFRNFDPTRYLLAKRTALDYSLEPAFFDLPEPFSVTTFDLPQSPLIPSLRGKQVSNWGSHSADVEPGSIPANLIKNVVSKFGEHPAGDGSNYANVDDPESLTRLFDDFVKGLRKRTGIIEDLWKDQDSDLVFACVSEPHNSGHYFWPRPDCDSIASACGGWRFLEDIYREVDASIGRLAQSIEPEESLVVFSVEGMRQNCEDIASTVFLPELLARQFLGHPFFDFSDDSFYPETQDFNWVTEIWRRHIEPEKRSSLLRRFFSPKQVVRIEQSLGIRPALFHPSLASDLNYQPPTWYQPYWPKMKAFALPSNSQGFIRINVKGRERNGIVSRSEYEATCAEIETLLRELKVPETGESALVELVRTRPNGPESEFDPSLSPADLVAVWNPDIETSVESPRFGRFGPVPYLRSGGHTPNGFIVASGPDIPHETNGPDGSVVDLGPTIRGILGVAPNARFDGENLFAQVAHSTESSTKAKVELSPDREKVAMVMCVKNEERFLAAHLLYHRSIGVDRAYIFLDACTDSTKEIVSRFHWVQAIELEFEERPEHFVDLQRICMDYALALSRRDGIDWLMTIDPDEFAFGTEEAGEISNGSEGMARWNANLTSMLAKVSPQTEMVMLKTLELIPGSASKAAPFWEQTHFWNECEILREIPHPKTSEMIPWQGFLGHGEGKGIVRTSAKVQAYDSHRWVPEQDCRYPDRPSFVPIPTEERGYHLHYVVTSPEHWQDKYRKLSIEPDHWPCGNEVEAPKQMWKESASLLELSEADEYYHSWIGQSEEKLSRLEKSGQAISIPVVQQVLLENDLIQKAEIRVPASVKFPSSETIDSLEDLLLNKETGLKNIVELGKVPARLLENAYPVEQLDGRLFRWLSTDSSIHLEVSPGNYEVRLIMGELFVHCGGLSSVRFNGTFLSLEKVEREEDGFRFHLSHDLFEAEGKQELSLTFPPVNTRDWPGEERVLGAAIFEIQFSPLPAEMGQNEIAP